MLNAVRPFVDFYRVASFSTTHPPKPHVRRFWESISHGWRAAARYRRLSLMSNDELARLGLDRASIGRRAFFGEPPFGRG